MKLSIPEQFMYSTVRIQCDYTNGARGTGTGFFYELTLTGKGSRVPLLVTNKHVVKDSVAGRILFTLAGDEGEPNHDRKFEWQIQDFAEGFINHPEPDIDLCAMPLMPLLRQMEPEGKDPFFIAVSDEGLVTEEYAKELTPIEEVVMIGYPIGLWDERNNLPIIRRGITATHPYFDYNGKMEFVVDIACFPGSSGSPVFLFNSFGHPTSKRFQIGSLTTRLLGILYAGPQMLANGRVEVVDIPTVQRGTIVTAIPINLGYVIKAKLLLDFEPILRKRVSGNSDVSGIQSESIETDEV